MRFIGCSHNEEHNWPNNGWKTVDILFFYFVLSLSLSLSLFWKIFLHHATDGKVRVVSFSKIVRDQISLIIFKTFLLSLNSPWFLKTEISTLQRAVESCTVFSSLFSTKVRTRTSLKIRWNGEKESCSKLSGLVAKGRLQSSKLRW